MKNKLLVLVCTLSSFSAVANTLETKPCASFARGAAESLYLTEATGIQGHTYDSSVVEYTAEKKNKTTDVVVAISASNDEGDSWDSKYTVTVALPHCSIVEINPAK